MTATHCTEEAAPARGTKAAVRYWAKRTRESLRYAEQLLREGDREFAYEVAEQASGEASEFHAAVFAAK